MPLKIKAQYDCPVCSKPMKNIKTKQCVKLLSNRHYTPYQFYFHNQYKPEFKRTSQLNF